MICPYCEKEVEVGEWFGEYLMHEECYYEFGEELENALCSDMANGDNTYVEQEC